MKNLIEKVRQSGLKGVCSASINLEMGMDATSEKEVGGMMWRAIRKNKAGDSRDYGVDYCHIRDKKQILGFGPERDETLWNLVVDLSYIARFGVSFQLIAPSDWRMQIVEYSKSGLVIHISDGSLVDFVRVAKLIDWTLEDVYSHWHMSFSEKTEEEYTLAGMDSFEEFITVNGLGE